MNMNTWNLRAPLQFFPLTAPRAVMAWATVVAIALLSFFVNVLHEQVQRGESFRAQFHGPSRVAVTQHGARAARPNARLSRQLAVNE